MTARLLRILLVVQLVAAALIAWGLVARGGRAPWAAVLTSVACVLAVRALIVANNFLMSWRFRDRTVPRTRLGFLATLRMIAGEYYATMLMSSWIMPRARACTRIHAHGPAAIPPVLLVHGYGCNSGYWRHLTQALDARGISHSGIDLEPMFADIDDFVPAVARAIGELRAKTGAAQITLVAHSMGGLVARAYLRAYGGAHIARVLTLGTPHHGTRLASFGVGTNAAQMRRVHGTPSPWLQALAASEDTATRARIASLYTEHDNIIAPHTSSLLDGARHHAFAGIGHVALGRHPAVLDQVLRELENATIPHPSV